MTSVFRSPVLYHFTAGHLIESIRREGLTLGALPWHRCAKTGEPLVIRSFDERFSTADQARKLRSCDRWLTARARKGDQLAAKESARLFPGFQWLTSNPDWMQPWCLLGNLPFAKNAHRITIAFPQVAMPALMPWPDLCARHNPPSADELNTPNVDWRNWFVFHGRIPPGWFVTVERNQGETLAAGVLGQN